MNKIQYVVLDEADEMLNMGFIESVKKIMTYFPENHTTALFSATMPEPILELAQKFMKNPVHIKIEETSIHTGIHYAYEIKEHEKNTVFNSAVYVKSCRNPVSYLQNTGNK